LAHDIGPDHKVMDIAAFYSALVQALKASHGRNKMKTLSVALMLLPAPAFALGKTFVCDVHSTASFTRGVLKPITNESYWLGIIKTVTFDEDGSVSIRF
jgi:hypothetical protein